MNSDWMRASAPAVTDVYTDLNGLQNLKVEKNNEVALRKVSEQFESMFINMLMKNMRSANKVFSEGNMFDSQEAQFYRDMHDQQLSLSLAHGRGFGIADAMYRQLSQSYGSGDTKPSRGVELDPSDHFSAAALPAAQVPQAMSVSLSDEAPAEQLGFSNRSKIADSPEDFIRKVMDSAGKAAQELGVEKEILIAQAALETGWGEKVFAQHNGQSSNNLFNIKADQRWQGESVANQTLEFLGGTFSTVAAKFRAYPSIQESFDDFTQFIKNSERYLPALNAGEGGLDFIKGIHKAGYATDPDYVSKVASVYARVKDFVSRSASEGDAL